MVGGAAQFGREGDSFMRSKEQVLAAGLVVLGLVLSSACSRSANSGAEASPNTGAQPANATNSAEPTGSAEAPGSSAQPITITKGTTVEVRLVDAVGSARNQSGDTFHATLAEPIEVHGTVAIPRGADIKGRVVSARASGHLKTPAELAVTLTEIGRASCRERG